MQMIGNCVEQYQTMVAMKEKGKRKIVVLVGTAVSVFSEINRIAWIVSEIWSGSVASEILWELLNFSY